MIERTEATFGIKPEWLAADTAYGSAPNLHFLVDEKHIAPHIPVIDKSGRDDGTFSREDFIFDSARDRYVCLNGKILPRSSGSRGPRGDDTISCFRALPIAAIARSSRRAARVAWPKITRHVHEAARDVARAIAKTAAYEQTRRDRKKVEMLFAHLKRILRMGRLRLRGPAGAQFEFTLAAIAQNLRRLAKLAVHPPDTAAPRVA